MTYLPLVTMNRRKCSFFHRGMGVVIAFHLLSVCAAEQIWIEIHEPAGIRRGGYPVHGKLTLPRAVPVTTGFRLLHADKPVVAQFRPQTGTNSNVGDRIASEWWLDFTTQLAPNEIREYVVQYGDDMPSGPERNRGHKLTEIDKDYIISNAPYLRWTIPRDLAGFVKSLDFPPSEHLRPDSTGLMIKDQQGKVHQLGGEGTSSRVIREGTMTVVLRFQKSETHPALQGVRWTADLIFPSPVSWVELQLQVMDPGNRVAALGMNLHLNLDSPDSGNPILVDLGASRTVYTSLFSNHSIELQAQLTATENEVKDCLSWRVLRGNGEVRSPFVMAPNALSRAEGWAHVMDRKRCLAIAFDRFGEAGKEQIIIDGDGTFTAWKHFSTHRLKSCHGKGKPWRSWLHFVHFPPQASAGADPQQMQKPIVLLQKQSVD